MLKIRFLVIGLGLLLLTTITPAETIHHTYYFEKPVIQTQSNGTHLAYFPDCYQAGIYGEPTVPLCKIMLLLPVSHSATAIELSYQHKCVLTEKVELTPRQAPKVLGDPADFYYRNEAVYQSQVPLEKPPVQVQTHFLNGHPIALACFSPVEYTPATQTLAYYKQVTVRIETKPSPQAGQAMANLSASASVKKRLWQLVDNKAAVASIVTGGNSAAVYDYLVITIQEFVENYQSLIRYYNERGLRTHLVTLDSIVQITAGADDAEKIRNFVQQEYQMNGIQIVSLAGDADEGKYGEMQIPTRKFYTEVKRPNGDPYPPDHVPSDLYYVALDGNWNTDGDEFWGEPGEDDLLPELAVGRICADNPAEIRNMIRKTINYQDAPVLADVSKILMVGEHLYSDPLTYGGDYLDLLIGGADVNGYVTVGYPVDLQFTYLYEKNAPWNQKELFEAINSGCNFINHDGHSTQSSVMGLRLDNITESNFAEVNGITHLNPIVYSHGCLAGAFDKNVELTRDCIGEEMVSLQNFAVTFIGNSRYGWFNEGQTEGPSIHLHREFISAIYGDSLTQTGTAHSMSRWKTAPFVTAPDQWEPGALRWTFYGCNILGDPALDLWTYYANEFTQLVYPDSLEAGLSAVVIATGEADARVTLSSEAGGYYSTLTDASGTAVLTIDSIAVARKWQLKVTKHNFVPFKADLFVKESGIIANIGASHSGLNRFRFALASAFPNPFNATTTIRFELSRAGMIRLEVFNIQGHLVDVLRDGFTEAGKYEVSWHANQADGTALSSGIYYIRLQAPEGALIKQCVLIR